MSELTLQLPDDVLDRLKSEAERQQVSLADVARAAIEHYLDDDEPTKEEILKSFQQSMRDALAGRVRPARTVLAEMRSALSITSDPLS